MSERLCYEPGCGHPESSHFGCAIGSFCKECHSDTDYWKWEHPFMSEPPVKAVKAPAPKVFFFGCMQGAMGCKEAGHFWWDKDGETKEPISPFGRFPDGTLAPDERGKTASSNYRGQPQGIASLTVRDGWTAIGFWDRTGDTRGGSNSNFIVRGVYDFDTMCRLAQEQFPDLWKRIGSVRLIQDGE